MKKTLQWAIEALKNEGIETARLDAEVLLSHATNKDRAYIYANPDIPIDKRKVLYYKALINERLLHKPVSYITGHKEFMSMDFKVDGNALIPRPETELIVEAVCNSGEEIGKILELGTGSGAIAISLAKYNPDWHIIATDISMQALLIAKDNALYHGVAERIRFIQTDLFDGLKYKFDLVISNPPYIPTGDLDSLSMDVKNYEPLLALDGGTDGLRIIKRIINGSNSVLEPNGLLVIEIGFGQIGDVIGLADNIGLYSDYKVVNDYSGIPRIFCCRHKLMNNMTFSVI